MAHSRTEKNLIPLQERLGGFGGFVGGENKSRRIHTALHKLALEGRSRKSRSFYSIPDVAAYFGVSQTTVHRVFLRMEQEGILQIVRGSQTLVRPKVPRIKANLRGIIATPVWISGLVMFPEFRRFYSTFEEAVRHRGYVADLILYGNTDTPKVQMDRILRHEPDLLLWLNPHQSQQSLIRTLEDCGVSAFVIADRPEIQEAAFRIDLAPGLREGLAEWSRAGIRQIELPAPHGQEVDSATHVLGSVLREVGIPWRSVRPKGREYSEYLRQLGCQPHTGVLMDNDYWMQHLLSSCQREFLDLLSRCRVAVFRDLNVPPYRLEGLHVDTLLTDYEEIGVAVAEAISSRQIGHRVFQPSWHCQVHAPALGSHFEID